MEAFARLCIGVLEEVKHSKTSDVISHETTTDSTAGVKVSAGQKIFEHQEFRIEYFFQGVRT